MPVVNIYICYTRWDGLEPRLTIAVQMAEVVALSQTETSFWQFLHMYKFWKYFRL